MTALHIPFSISPVFPHGGRPLRRLDWVGAVSYLFAMSDRKTNLLGCTLAELGEFVQSLGEPRYRGAQLFQWLYRHGAPSFAAMTSLGREFRALLAESADIEGLQPVTQQVSAADGTTKYLFVLTDGLRIESVLIPPASAFTGAEAAAEEEQKRLTVCVSTQVGCPLDCAFCATASMGFRRNLGPGEIVDQVLQVQRLSGRAVTNVVFMGMGEPLMNYDAVMAAAEIMVNGIGLAARRITISTAGWVDGIRRLASADLKVKLAISLHSAEETTRAKLMPVTRRHSLAELMDAVEEYYRRTKRRVTYEVIFFDGVNDTPDAIRASHSPGASGSQQDQRDPVPCDRHGGSPGGRNGAAALPPDGRDCGTAQGLQPDRDGAQQCGRRHRCSVRPARRQE